MFQLSIRVVPIEVQSQVIIYKATDADDENSQV